MRKSVIKLIQTNISNDEAVLILNTEYLEYLELRKDLKVLLILKHKFFYLTNSFSNDEKYIIGCANFIVKIDEILKANNIGKVKADYNYLPVQYYYLLNDKYLIENYIINYELKINNDLFVMLVNATILKKVIIELLSFVDVSKTYKVIEQQFKFIISKYDCEDFHFSITSNNNLTNKFENFNFIDIYYIDCGIKYQGLYSDFTIAIKFSNFSIEEKNCFKLIGELFDFIKNKENIIDYTSNALYNEIENITRRKGYKLSQGIGHGVGIKIHESVSISSLSNSGIKDKTFLAIEPMLYLNNKTYRLEKTLGLFENKIIDFFNDFKMIYEIK